MRFLKTSWISIAVLLAVGCGDDEKDTTIKYAPDTCGEQGLVGETAVIRYPYTVTVDGNLDEAAWTDPLVKWYHFSGAGHSFVNTAGTIGPATDEADFSIDFAIVADADYMYVAYKITDQAIITDYTDVSAFASRSNQDGYKFDIDAGHEGNVAAGAPVCQDINSAQPCKASGRNGAVTSYDMNDSTWSIGLDGFTRVSSSNLLMTKDYLVTAPAVMTATGYTAELAIKNVLPGKTVIAEEGNSIGFDIVATDRDIPPGNGGTQSILYYSFEDIDDTHNAIPAHMATGYFCGPLHRLN